jgi:predicted ArsR family transcriptional regulator
MGTDMSNLQLQARALGDPTRHEIFRYLAQAGRPVDVSELTEHFGFNHNAIRQHLAKLMEADLVVERKAPAGGRGRRRILYSPHPAADSRWGVLGPYERLSLLLAEIVRSGDTPIEVGRRAARDRIRGLVEADGAVEELVDQMTRLGFEPVVKQRGKQVHVVLHECPFSSTAVADPETVCALHLGMAQGIAEDSPGLVIDELVAKDPRRANCRLVCHIETAAS